MLSVAISEGKSTSYWIGLLDELKAWGVQDIYIACINGLIVFKQAIQDVFSHIFVQRYLVHLILQSTQFVSYQDIKSFFTKWLSEQQLSRYLKPLKQNGIHWFLEPLESRKTVLKESINCSNFQKKFERWFISQIQLKVIIFLKGEGEFPNETSVVKLIYLQILEVAKK